MAKSVLVFIMEWLKTYESSYRLEGAIQRVIAEHRHAEMMRQVFLRKFGALVAVDVPELEANDEPQLPDRGDLIIQALLRIQNFGIDKELFHPPERNIQEDIKEWSHVKMTAGSAKAQAIQQSALEYPRSFHLFDLDESDADEDVSASYYVCEMIEDLIKQGSGDQKKAGTGTDQERLAKARAASAKEFPQSWKPRFSRFGRIILPSRV